jgi:hypothetical protein
VPMPSYTRYNIFVCCYSSHFTLLPSNPLLGFLFRLVSVIPLSLRPFRLLLLHSSFPFLSFSSPISMYLSGKRSN